MLNAEIHHSDCVEWLRDAAPGALHLSFVDPPFNQGKDYRDFDDNQSSDAYWTWMRRVLSLLRDATAPGGWVYFMQREKNAEFVLQALREAGWNFRNLIVWKKKTSAVPCNNKFGLNYQIIATAIKGDAARAFNRLRISPPLPPNYKQARADGMYVTDIWDDIRELTSGYYAGAEALRDAAGERFHKQQSPLALLARIILASSNPDDVVFDPFAGTGTTLAAAALLNRRAVGVEIDAVNVDCVKERIARPRRIDIETIRKLRKDYAHTANLSEIWGEGVDAADNGARLEAQKSLSF